MQCIKNWNKRHLKIQILQGFARRGVKSRKHITSPLEPFLAKKEAEVLQTSQTHRTLPYVLTNKYIKYNIYISRN